MKLFGKTREVLSNIWNEMVSSRNFVRYVRLKFVQRAHQFSILQQLPDLGLVFFPQQVSHIVQLAMWQAASGHLLKELQNGSPCLDICALTVHVPGAWGFWRDAVTRL